MTGQPKGEAMNAVKGTRTKRQGKLLGGRMMMGKMLGNLVGRAVGVGLTAAVCLGFGVTAAEAQRPTVVLNQTRLLGGLPAGGAFGSGNAAGSSMVVNSSGNLVVGTSYGNTLVVFNGATGVATTLGTISNLGPVAIDSNDNVYVGDVYDSFITKIPYSGGAYAAASTPSASTPVCVGSDTKECVLPALTTNSIAGYVSMAFDPTGNLYFATTNSGTYANSIYECNAACLKNGGTAVMLYQEPATVTVTADMSKAQLLVGGMVIDSFGDLFFADSNTAAGNSESVSSNLKELKALSTSATLHAATPVTIYTITNASPGAYDNQIDAVALDSSGNIYFGDEFDGVFGFLSNAGVVDTTSLFTISTTGAKILTSNLKGNFYIVAYSNSTGGDAATVVSVGTLTAPASGIGATSTIPNVATILNSTAAASCGGTTPTYASSTTEFSATAGACTTANVSSAAVYATTVSFTPSASGTRTATLTATSGTSMGTAALTGVGIASTTATPTFSPAGGTYTTVQSVTLADTTAGSTIYYTTDGTTPTTSSTAYTGPITVGSTETIKAIAAVSGTAASAVASATYTINLPAAATPVATPGAGTYTSIQTVTLTDATAGATIYYTLDGSNATSASMTYTSPITVSKSEVITVIAGAPGYNASAAAQFAYTINLPVAATPAFTPSPGTYISAQMVTLTDSTPGAKIYYTTDGTMPTTASTAYTTAIKVGATTTINAIAAATGYNPSAVGTGVYTINLPAAAPTFTPAPGTFTAVQTVTIADATPGAVIYYTTDGSAPSISSPVYSKPLTVGVTETINAFATAPGFSASAASPATYTITLPAFSLAVQPGSLTVASGGQGLANVTVTPQNGFSTAVTFACSGLPTGASCSFAPASVTPNSSFPVTTVMTINVGATTARNETSPLFPTTALAAALCMLGWRKRRGVKLALMLLVAAAGMSLLAGCSSGTAATTTTGTTSTVTVTATAGALTQTATMSLIVQ